jgi:hypothetical protein
MISLICKKYGIENYTINSDGSIDVNGDVWINNKELTELPLTFNKVTGYFDCGGNSLTTLKGCPRWVGCHFLCNRNKLSSLEFSPDYVTGWFSCKGNDLIDNYIETEIGGYFYTTSKQDGLILNDFDKATNYNEWRKIYKRKQILNDIFKIGI